MLKSLGISPETIEENQIIKVILKEIKPIIIIMPSLKKLLTRTIEKGVIKARQNLKAAKMSRSNRVLFFLVFIIALISCDSNQVLMFINRFLTNGIKIVL